ncbi:MAG: sodium:solute symporter family protein [Methanocorpusculum sp.]|nr:sodium:solute symporter family protein [Methanocorpusculum sp.]MEA5086302.1 sodium:solute symporter family protein [Methanocorpusculum sp.]
MMMTVSTELTIGIVAFYLVMIIGIGYYGYRRTKKVEDYMVAGRNTHPVIIALSYGATFISTSAIIGFGGTSAQYGMSLMWLTVLCIVVGVIIAFICMGKRIRRIGKDLGALTYPELLGKMYGSKKIIYATGAIFVAAMPLYTAAVLIGGARFIETTLGIPYMTALLGFAGVVALYVVIGGLMAVMYTDAVQGAIMLVGMGVLLVLTYIYLGGVTAANSALDSMGSLVPSTLSSMGMTGWTSMPEFGSPIWMTVITTLVLGVGVGVLAQPQLAVRFMTAKDGKSLNRAIPIGALFIVMMTGVAFTVGPLTNVYFMDTVGMLAIDAAGGNADSIIPLYINSAMPELFVIIFMLTLLSAAMSTLSSLLHTMGTTLGGDIFARMKGVRYSIRANQIGIVVMMIVSVILAVMMPGSIIARATAMFMGLCTAALLPAFVHGITSKTPSYLAAKWSMTAGAGGWLLWAVFCHTAESKMLGICHALFGVDSLVSSPWCYLDPLVVGAALSVTILLVLIPMDKHKITHEDQMSLK